MTSPFALCGAPYHPINSCRVCHAQYERARRAKKAKHPSGSGFRGPECNECGGVRSEVKESGYTEDGQRIRRRVCLDCGQDATSVEVYLPAGLSTFWRLNPGRATRKRENDYARRGKGIYRLPNRRAVPDRLIVSVELNKGGRVRPTHCRRGHEMTPENTYISPGTQGRYCHECRKLRQNERRRAA